MSIERPAARDPNPVAASAPDLPFRPYRAETGGAAMYPLRDDAKTLVRRLGLTNSFGYYRDIVECLAGLKRHVIRPLRDFAVPVPAGYVLIGLRHDMDTEPYSSLDVARELHAAGLMGSFYVLHTAEYYGQWIDGVFRRTEEIAPMLRQIQDDYRCEVGLHNDGLWVYQNSGVDGSQAVADELAWLRREGLHIVGTAAHNSAPVYGAENFELFRGRSGRSSCTLVGGRQVSLQTLDEEALGLTYEANAPEIEPDGHSRLDEWLRMTAADPVRDPTWMRHYLVDHPLCRWGSDFNVWLIGRDRWVIGGHRCRRPVFLWDVAFDQVAHFLNGAPDGCRVVLHVHPLYIDLEHPEPAPR
jgi:hypothetical protein